MSRTANVDILFKSNLAAQKAQWDSFLAYVAQNQPSINGVPIGGGGSAGARTTATTFGGLSAVSGGFQTGGNRIGLGGSAFAGNGFGGAVGGGAQLAQSLNPAAVSSLTQALNALASTLTRGGQGGQPSPGGGGGGGSGNGGPSGFRAGIRRAFGQEGFRQLGRYIGAYGIAQVGENYLNQQNQYSIGMAGAMSGEDIIRTQAEYQSNSPLARIPIAGALGMSMREYAMGDQAALASIGAGTALGDQNVASRQQRLLGRLSTSATIAGANGDFAGRREQIGLRTRGNILSGQNPNNTDITNLSVLKAGADQEIEAFKNQYRSPEGILDMGEVPRRNLKAMQDKADAIGGRLGELRQSNTDIANNQNALSASELSVLNRQENASIIGSNSRLRSLGLRFSNTRGADLESISGGYDERIAASGDPAERRRLGSERRARLGLEDAEYSRDTGFAFGETQIGATRLNQRRLSGSHFDFAASQEGFRAQGQEATLNFQRATAGLDANDPLQLGRLREITAQYTQQMAGLAADAAAARRDFNAETRSMGQRNLSNQQGLLGNSLASGVTGINATFDDLVNHNKDHEAQINASRITALQGNSLADLDRRFSVGMGTTRIRQSTRQTDLRTKFLGRTADVEGLIDTGTDEIAQANVELKGDANRPLLAERIAAIRANTLSGINLSTNPLKYGGRLEQVGAFVTGGDPGNPAYRDLRSARELAGSAAGRLDDATKKTDLGGQQGPTQQQVQDLQTKMQQLIDAVRSL